MHSSEGDKKSNKFPMQIVLPKWTLTLWQSDATLVDSLVLAPSVVYCNRRSEWVWEFGFEREREMSLFISCSWIFKTGCKKPWKVSLKEDVTCTRVFDTCFVLLLSFFSFSPLRVSFCGRCFVGVFFSKQSLCLFRCRWFSGNWELCLPSNLKLKWIFAEGRVSTFSKETIKMSIAVDSTGTAQCLRPINCGTDQPQTCEKGLLMSMSGKLTDVTFDFWQGNKKNSKIPRTSWTC